ncbi:putative resolvase [Tupanvirus soda lake]|uniref:Resolvase n=2 Tax=Tupanvirus TaxID=2094720 RepID=A0AC62AD90_9VIRU|nr:putative resolvase [Tupanvirus soda lake]QKU35667.1 putative resolvase [Tupanvirus soda lake]
MSKYVSGKKASEILKVHQRTLHNWDRKGIIDTIRGPGGRRLYNVKKYLEEYEDDVDIISDDEENDDKLKIAYVRVSTNEQKDDLQRQIKYMKKHYPNHKIIEDIGSGINFNRKGLRKIIKWAIEGKIKEVVVAYKDRLTRFGFELIEDLIKEYSEGKIKVINKENKEEPEIELAKDVLQIMNVFTAKMNGLRKYK